MKTYTFRVKVIDKGVTMEYTTKAKGKSGEVAKDDVIRNEYACFRKLYGHSPEKVVAFINNPDIGSYPEEEL